MNPRPLPAIPLFGDDAPALRNPVSHVAAFAWWALKVHVAEANGLPRESAGPDPNVAASRRRGS
ncbi:MAG: hypothetical protein E7812_13260 [Phenylobacterium sp.]|nr:MAG: hypothetical protein E7812_13260 [Phenylobacterium sp.]